jgi:hypothetical protein
MEYKASRESVIDHLRSRGARRAVFEEFHGWQIGRYVNRPKSVVEGDLEEKKKKTSRNLGSLQAHGRLPLAFSAKG